MEQAGSLSSGKPLSPAIVSTVFNLYKDLTFKESITLLYLRDIFQT